MKVMEMLSSKYLAGKRIDETYVKELCHAATKYDALFAKMAVTALPHDKLYLDLRSNYAWWADDSLAKLYGTWRGGAEAIEHAAKKLPSAIQAISDAEWSTPDQSAWEVPTRADIEEPFFKESKRRALSFKNYIKSFGGPADGFYDVSAISKAPKFNLWLNDTFVFRESYTGGVNVFIFYYAQRAYARPDAKERDFRKTNASSCESKESGCRLVDFGDYGNYKNYFYPVNKRVRNVTQYYPWLMFAKLRETYKNFDHNTIVA